MLPREQMQFGAQIIAAVFGGPGIFYLWESFRGNPGDAATAFLYLGLATALLLAAGRGGAADKRPGTLAWCKARLPGAQRRRRR